MLDMTRISIPVTVNERELLRAAASRELRAPRAHARYLLRGALGLTNDEVQTQPNADLFLDTKNGAGSVLPDTSAVLS